MSKATEEIKAILTLAIGSMILMTIIHTALFYVSWNFGVSPVFKAPEVTFTQSFFLGIFISLLKPSGVKLSKRDDNG